MLFKKIGEEDDDMKIIKRNIIAIFTIISIVAVSTFSVNAVSKDSVTVEDVSDIIDEYLMSKNIDIEKGTPEYVDFLVDFMMNEFTHELSKNEYSDYIKEYATSYILASQNEPIDEETGTFDEIPDAIQGKTMKQLEKERSARINYDNMVSNQVFGVKNSVSPKAAYSVSKAVSYAKTYATKRNANFKNFGTNCTNFVSQAVNSGGKGMTVPSSLSSKPQAYVTSKYWYNKWIDVGAGTAYRKEPRYSTGWTGVVDFHAYWKSKGATVINYSSMSSLQNGAKLGDIVQLYGSKGWYHSIIITGGSKGNWKYCGNSNNRLDAALSGATASKYRVIRIK